jgi:hypothetical protein
VLTVVQDGHVTLSQIAELSFKRQGVGDLVVREQALDVCPQCLSGYVSDEHHVANLLRLGFKNSAEVKKSDASDPAGFHKIW